MEEVKLVKDENREEETESVAMTVNHPDVHELAVLKEKLGAVGVKMSLVMDRGSDHGVLIFGFRDEYVRNKTRCAGRKKDYKMEQRYKECTVSELKMKLKTMKRCDIIAELGCPKTTFYRIINKLKELECDFENEDSLVDDVSIWIYTS